MSESMTTVEIEDVLSSIRRLVSEDLRPTHKLVSAALHRGASKLILTPALRIVSDVRSALPDGGHSPEDGRDLATVLHYIEAEDAGQSAEILPVFGSVRLHDTAHTAQGDVGPMVSDANFLTSAMSRINGLTSAGNDTALRGQSDTIEAVVAVVGAAVGPDEWEVDGGDPAPQAEAWTDTVWHTAAVSEPVATAGADVLYLNSPVNITVQDNVAEVAVHDTQSDTVLPQATAENGAEFLSEDSIVFHDDIVSQLETAGPKVGEPQDDATEFDDSAEYLNEDVLRDIVRDMIREELQGTLGEKITRNVRKLVRAEINRALAAHDYGDQASRA